MKVEQAIHTSLQTTGRSGYHIVARSAGVSNETARQIALRCPSHGSLIRDPSNQASLNAFPLNDGRWVVSRTCQGPPEYSGRGGACLYTHALLIDKDTLNQFQWRFVRIYRQALALGHLVYRPVNGPKLTTLDLGDGFDGILAGPPPTYRPEWKEIAEAQTRIRSLLASGESVELRIQGDRIEAADYVLSLLPGELARSISFSTSLRPCASRGFQLSLMG